MPAERSKLSLPDLRHLLIAGALVAGALGTLVLGAALQVEPTAAETAPPPRAANPPAPGGTVAAPEREPEPARPQPAASPTHLAAPEPAAAETARQATAPRRAAALPQPEAPSPAAGATRGEAIADDAWTLQFAMTCNPATADELQRRIGADDRLWVLPHRHQGRSCNRIGWGNYPDRDSAVAANDIPDALRALSTEPVPKRMADLRP